MKNKAYVVIQGMLAVLFILNILSPAPAIAESTSVPAKTMPSGEGLVTKTSPLFNSKDRFFDVTTFGDSVWVAGQYGLVLFSPDGGKSWERQETGFDKPLLGICAISTEKVIAVGHDGIIIMSTDGGDTWQKIESPAKEALYQVTFVTNTVGWIVGAYSTLLKSKDGGQTWQSIESEVFFVEGGRDTIPIIPMMNDVCFIDENVGWIVGELGTAFRTDDGGQNWTLKNTGIEPLYLTCVSFQSKKSGMIMGENGNVFVTNDGGETWQKMAGADIANTMFASVSVNGEYLVVGDVGHGYVLNPVDGTTKTLFSNFRIGNRWLSDIEFTSKGYKIICGKGVILVSRNKGNSTDQWTMYLPFN